MIVQRHQIIAAIHDLWPDLIDGHASAPGHIYIPRTEYYAPGQDDFQRFVTQDWTGVIENIGYDINRWACTNYAAAMSVQADLFVLWQLSLNVFEPSAMREWALMEVWGTRFHGEPTSHAVNMVYMKDHALWFFEPQTDNRAWRADPDRDTVHFIKL